jgi:hypothetical protein
MTFNDSLRKMGDLQIRNNDWVFIFISETAKTGAQNYSGFGYKVYFPLMYSTAFNTFLNIIKDKLIKLYLINIMEFDIDGNIIDRQNIEVR